MRSFEAPKDSPVLISLTKLILPAIIKLRHGDTHLEIVGNGLQRFKALRGKRTVICPNHPSSDDSDMLFALSRAVGETFNFLTAWEVFHGGGGRQRWLQYMGCYSVIRGAPDHASFRATRDLIARGRKKIVIFPEGEISHENDELLPLKAGAVQMSFSAMEKLDRTDQLAPVFILPLALKYIYRSDIRCALDMAIARLEEQLNMATDHCQSLYSRMRLIAESVLGALEAEYNYKPAAGASLNERIVGLRSAILRQVAVNLKVDLPPGKTQLEWAHLLQSKLYALRYERQPGTSVRLKQIARDRAEQLKSLTMDLHRVINFITIYEGYVKDPATQEQLADMVDLLEEEVLGHRSIKGPRSALMDIGNAINLLDFYDDYKQDRIRTVCKVNHILAGEISAMLHNLELHREPVYVTKLSDNYSAQVH